MSQPVIEEYRKQIKSSGVHPLARYGTREFRADHGTSHASLVAPNGDACAVTSSINLIFGSKIMGAKTNIIYNNQMDDFAAPNCECNSFALPNYRVNFIQPGRRPVSSMTPLIAVNPAAEHSSSADEKPSACIISCVITPFAWLIEYGCE